MLGMDEIVGRYRSVPVAADQAAIVAKVRGLFITFTDELDRLLPDGRLKSVAFTDLESASHFAVKAASRA